MDADGAPRTHVRRADACCAGHLRGGAGLAGASVRYSRIRASVYATMPLARQPRMFRDQHNQQPAASTPISRGLSSEKIDAGCGACSSTSGTMMAVSVHTGA